MRKIISILLLLVMGFSFCYAGQVFDDYVITMHTDKTVGTTFFISGLYLVGTTTGGSVVAGGILIITGLKLLKIF